MVDVFTPEKRSSVMAAIRGRGNQSTELRLISLMREAKIVGWRRGSKLTGKPDFVFPKQKIAVFVDGDFWHGHPSKCRMPTGNRAFWVVKINSNKMRDRKVNQILRASGWCVLRFWESALRVSPLSCLIRLRGALEERKSKV